MVSPCGRELQLLQNAQRRRVVGTGHRRDPLEAGREGGVQDGDRCFRPVPASLRVGCDDAADVELAPPLDLLPLEAGQRDRAAALSLDRRPEAHPAVALEAVDLLPDPLLRLSEVCGVLDAERPDDEPFRLDRQLDPQVFCHTDTCFVLSAVNGERSQSAQRSRSSIPASRAIRSSSAGETERNGTDSRPPVAVTREKW